VEGNPKSMAGRRSVPIPERLVPLFKARIGGRPHGAPAVASRRGSRLSLENWKRSVTAGRCGPSPAPKSDGPHAAITVTAHTHADLF